MSSSLGLYIGENDRFDRGEFVRIISGMLGVKNVRPDGSFEASVRCEYTYNDRVTVVSLMSDGKFVWSDGLGDDSLSFAIEFQRHCKTPLRAIDSEYSFDLDLSEIVSIDEFRSKISA